MFAEVILPLPLQGTFTYSIPDELAGKVSAGSRVMVQFGKKKYYTGVVASISPTPSRRELEIKPLMALLDDQPIASRLQIKLWEWVAEYYLCSVGEVMKAALPAGLKPESETKVSLSKEWDRSTDGLTESQASIVAFLDSQPSRSISEIVKETGFATAGVMVERMLHQGIVEISEKVVERYRPRKELMVRLLFERDDNEALHNAMETLNRSPKQQKLLLAYLELSGWLRRDTPLADVTRSALLEKTGASPAALKGLIDKGILEVYRQVINRFSPVVGSVTPLSPLSPAQQRAITEIRASMLEKQVTLLHGVTGSGKTEVYSHLIDAVLGNGKKVLFLVPEISLTTQLTDRLRKVFGDRMIVYHSKFTDNERVEIYRRLASEKGPMLVVGVRSSVFLPLDGLGLVIVDEEHEASYKQFDPAPRYNARDVAIMLAVRSGAKVLLGSATPAVESYYKAVNGKYGLVTLPERYGDAILPEVEIIDMRMARKQKSVRGILSDRLRMATVDTLTQGRQAIMFQNRRGFAPVVVCRQCGWSPKCENCDVSLVYHKGSGTLRCHYCGFSRQLPALCPVCETNEIEVYGYGTERIAEELHEVFPDYRVARMDLDTTRNKDTQQEIIEEFANRQTDILVGTQMVSKGLDFAGVDLVGVLNADTLLNFPDFRSSERAFNMLEQVAGRAGRRGAGGKVMIQTTKPESPVLTYMQKHDYLGYYAAEIADRESYFYPPFSKIVMVYLKHKDARLCDIGAVVLANALRSVFGNRVLGPEKPFVSRVATWYLQCIMLKIEAGASMTKVKDLLRQVYAAAAQDPNLKGSQIYYDVDPA